MNKVFSVILLCFVFALYVNALPVNVVEKSDSALVTDLDDDLEVAETKHHYKKKQHVYVHPQPVYVAVLVPVKSGGGHGGGYGGGHGGGYGGGHGGGYGGGHGGGYGGGYGGHSSYNYGSYQQSSYGHKSKHG